MNEQIKPSPLHPRTAQPAQGTISLETNGNGNGSGFRDPAFADNKLQPVHRWVPWIAGFSARFVDDCFHTYLDNRRMIERPCILDPFAGVGTTLVTAVQRGYDAVGFEINPYAALACKVKLCAGDLDVNKIEKLCARYRDTPRNGHRPQASGPTSFKTRIPFFGTRVETQVLSYLDFVAEIQDNDIADVFRLALGTVMVKFSNYTYEPSLGTRPGAGKPLIDDADVRSIITSKLREIVADMRWMKNELALRNAQGRGLVHNMNFMGSAQVLPAQSVDLMVTSPPYMNNYHYIRNTRPQLYWLSLVTDSADLKTLEDGNVGKYWQTVRDGPEIKVQFTHKTLEKTLKQLRETRVDRGPYGGPGWANYVASYFNDSLEFLVVLKRALKRHGAGVIVIGNSIIQGFEVKADIILGDLAKQIGLELEDIHPIRSKRVGASITQSTVRRGETCQATLYESAVVVRKR
jgi:DNA modification methylase